MTGSVVLYRHEKHQNPKTIIGQAPLNGTQQHTAGQLSPWGRGAYLKNVQLRQSERRYGRRTSLQNRGKGEYCRLRLLGRLVEANRFDCLRASGPPKCCPVPMEMFAMLFGTHTQTIHPLLHPPAQLSHGGKAYDSLGVSLNLTDPLPAPPCSDP